MDLNTLWFVVIAVLYAGFFALEGFDFGVGVLLPFVGKDDARRRMALNAVGPHWDGNEVWLITAGGASFAAFPHWYATLFSGFYLPFFLLLLALILRGVAFEFRSKDDNPRWRALWDWAAFSGSLAAAFLLGVTFANIVRGVPIDSAMTPAAGLGDLLNPYALLGGLGLVLTFTLHGSLFLSLKTTGEVADAVRKAAARLWLLSAAGLIAFLIVTAFATDMLARAGGVAAGVGVVLAALASGVLIRARRHGWAFVGTCVAILLFVATLFLTLYPRLLVSSLNPDWSLTIYNAASGPYTLRVMTIVALALLPFVLAYQAWSYWVFRRRLQHRPEDLTY